MGPLLLLTQVPQILVPATGTPTRLEQLQVTSLCTTMGTEAGKPSKPIPNLAEPSLESQAAA